MAETRDRDKERQAQWGYPLLLCFVAGLLAGSAMLLPHWDSDAILLAVLGSLLSAVLLYALWGGLLLHRLRSDVVDAGCDALALAAVKPLRRMDHLLIDDPHLLRREERCLAAWQPHLDSRVRPLMLALARQSLHPLARILVEALEKAGVMADSVTNMQAHPSGQVNGQWHSHQLCLYAAPIRYGDLKLSMHLRIDGQAAAAVVFDENIRPDAVMMVQRVKRMGITPILYACDRAELMAPMARQLGLMAETCRDAPEKQRAMQRHLAADHAALLLAQGAEAGQWQLCRLGAGGAVQDILLRGRAMVAIPAAVAAVRDYAAVRQFAMRAVVVSHLAALALIISGLPDIWVWVSAWALCGLSMRHVTMRQRREERQMMPPAREGAAI